MNTFSPYSVFRRAGIRVTLLTFVCVWALSGISTSFKASAPMSLDPGLIGGPMPSGSPWAFWR